MGRRVEMDIGRRWGEREERILTSSH